MKFISKNRVATPIARQIVLSEMYDEFYEIANHNDLNKPLSIISYHEKEDYRETSLEYRTLSSFTKNDVGKFFNISFLEYLQLPIYIHSMMLDLSKEMMKRSSTAASEFMEDLDNI